MAQTPKKNVVVKPKTATESKHKKPAALKQPANSDSLPVGSTVPSFKLPATMLEEADSKKLSGKPYILYFYPKDDTSGCTAEACGFRDALPAFGKLGVTVIGVSKDSLASHEKFAKKYQLTFPLISDETGKLCAAYGVWVEKSMYGRKYMGIERSTFLIDGKGKLRASWRKVSVPGHIEEVKQAVSQL
jgi:peroxiredoxin Q/BCP